jgi:hypothetical protein
MIYDIIGNKPIRNDDGILPLQPTAIIPEPKTFNYSDFGGQNPFRNAEPTRGSGTFSYGTGGGKRVIRSTRGLS